MDVEVGGNTGITSSQTAIIPPGLKPRLLEGLNPAETRAVVAAATRRRFGANTQITSEGDLATHLFLMLDGGARFYTVSPQGKKTVIRWIPAGDVVGGVAFVWKPLEYIISAEAANKTSALVWDRDTIRSLAATYPKLVENALVVASDFLILFRVVHIAANCHSAPQRLAQVLGYLAKDMGRKVRGGVELQIRNEELAQEANVTIFTVSRLMGEWQRKGLLKKGRGKVLLRWPEKLIQLEA